MKLIALKDFRNNFKLEVDDAVHPDVVHKGYEFEVGKAKDLAGLRKEDAEAAFLVAQLTVARCVGDGSDSKVIEAVKEDILQDKKREANAKKLQQAADGSALMAQLTALLQKASATPAPATK